MTKMNYGWLQEALSELIRHTMEAGLYAVTSHLNAALSKVCHMDGERSARSRDLQLITVKLALEECHVMLADLGEHDAAQDVAQAMAQMPEGAPVDAVLPRLRHRGGSSSSGG